MLIRISSFSNNRHQQATRSSAMSARTRRTTRTSAWKRWRHVTWARIAACPLFDGAVSAMWILHCEGFICCSKWLNDVHTSIDPTVCYRLYDLINLFLPNSKPCLSFFSRYASLVSKWHQAVLHQQMVRYKAALWQDEGEPNCQVWPNQL